MLELKGVSGSSPIGFMSALGLLRVLHQDVGIEIRLGWRRGHAVLFGLDKSSEIIDIFVEHMRERYKACELNWRSTAKGVPAADYKEAARAWEGDERALGFLAGFGTDTILNDDGTIRGSRLDLTSGQQKLIQGLSGLAKELSEENTARRAFDVALFGGSYDDQTSFNWDPATIKLHAHESKAPTLQKPKGKKGQVWLAAEAFPFHPVIPMNGRAVTIGCEQINGRSMYFWPLWDEMTPLGYDEVRFLRELSFDVLLRRNLVTEIWGSEFGKSGKYGILLPARRLV